MKSLSIGVALLALCSGSATRAADATAISLTRGELESRLAAAIKATAGAEVVLDDVLGEGPGAWDSDPRYPKGRVNCIIWLQLLLAEAYGAGLDDKTPVLDRIRYFGGEPAFGLRKHYTDHWVMLEPQPLARVDLTGCAEVSRRSIEMQPERFVKHSGYGCPILHQELTRFHVSYVEPTGLRSCAKALRAGYYVMFAVPTDSYMKRYLAETGPMALVHAMILELTASEAVVHHASTAKHKVLHEPLDEFLRKSRTIHHGYALFELDPAWNFRAATPPRPEAKAILECEAKLPRNAHH